MHVYHPLARAILMDDEEAERWAEAILAALARDLAAPRRVEVVPGWTVEEILEREG